MPDDQRDKRTVSTDALETLGTIIGEHEKRDAIHLAVEPVTAGADLSPGERVFIIDGTAYPSRGSECHGIVDPFLFGGVRKGHRFWFVMKPRMVHSLRHVWTHPDFPDEVPDSSVSSAKKIPAEYTAEQKAKSEAWLRAFCSHADCPGFDTVMAAIQGDFGPYDAKYYGEAGHMDDEYLHFNERDAHGEIPDEFWDHAEIFLGKNLPTRAKQFSCSC